MSFASKVAIVTGASSGIGRATAVAFAASGANGLGDEFARIRQRRRSPLAAVHDVAQCVAAMADTPETLSNSWRKIMFLSMGNTCNNF